MMKPAPITSPVRLEHVRIAAKRWQPACSQREKLLCVLSYLFTVLSLRQEINCFGKGWTETIKPSVTLQEGFVASFLKNIIFSNIPLTCVCSPRLFLNLSRLRRTRIAPSPHTLSDVSTNTNPEEADKLFPPVPPPHRTLAIRDAHCPSRCLGARYRSALSGWVTLLFHERAAPFSHFIVPKLPNKRTGWIWHCDTRIITSQKM